MTIIEITDNERWAIERAFDKLDRHLNTMPDDYETEELERAADGLASLLANINKILGKDN
jgi:hypothetical protein